jgi:hypothetical protein
MFSQNIFEMIVSTQMQILNFFECFEYRWRQSMVFVFQSSSNLCHKLARCQCCSLRCVETNSTCQTNGFCHTNCLSTCLSTTTATTFTSMTSPATILSIYVPLLLTLLILLYFVVIYTICMRCMCKFDCQKRMLPFPAAAVVAAEEIEEGVVEDDESAMQMRCTNCDSCNKALGVICENCEHVLIERLPRFVASNVNDQCSICLVDEVQTTLLLLPCTHRFHAACITTWLNDCHDCPECRTAITNDAYADEPTPGVFVDAVYSDAV